MSRSVALVALCAAFAVALPARASDAQATTALIDLSVTVLPQATVERVSAPIVARRVGDTTEYRVTVVVRANTPYRVVARRADAAGRGITLGVGSRTIHLEAGRAAVQVARGDLGVTTFEISYAVDGENGGEPAAPSVRFEPLTDTLGPGK